jgi:hypothetical protein
MYDSGIADLGLRSPKLTIVTMHDEQEYAWRHLPMFGCNRNDERAVQMLICGRSIETLPRNYRTS